MSTLQASSRTQRFGLASDRSRYVCTRPYHCHALGMYLIYSSLQITDQPRDCPSQPLPQEERETHVILSLNATSLSAAADTTELASAIFTLIDNFHRLNLRPETKSKLKKTRDELDHKLKLDAEKEKKEEVGWRFLSIRLVNFVVVVMC